MSTLLSILFDLQVVQFVRSGRIAVSTGASHAPDPGSIPGRSTLSFCTLLTPFLFLLCIIYRGHLWFTERYAKISDFGDFYGFSESKTVPGFSAKRTDKSITYRQRL